jgi:endonuclease G
LGLGLWLPPFAASAFIGTAYQMPLGNPSGAIANTNNHSHYLILRSVQALDYNDSLGQPNWASWSLTASDIGTNRRSSFLTDTNLPPNFYRVKPGEYAGSGYDRGHLCPSKDRTDTDANNDLVFHMSNLMPQHPVNNSGVWGQFENYCRSLATNDTELLITCGPSGFTGARLNTNGYVAIPSYTWKIVVVVPPGPGLATNRLTATNRVIALKIPNSSAATNPWPAYATSANQIQVDTGLTFFTALPADLAVPLRAKVDGQTNPPPAIAALSPTSGEASNLVIITGTNFAPASAVAFNGAVAAFTVDFATQITATVPTNAGSGFLSVTTPSGTAISSNAFTVLSDGGTVYRGILAGWDVSSLPGGLNNYGPATFAPSTNAPSLVIGSLTRGSGVKTTGSAAAGGWGGDGFTSATVAAALAASQFVTFSVTATNGCKVSFASLSRLDYYRSATGPSNGVLQIQVGTSGFADVANFSYPAVSTGASLGAIDLSKVGELQLVGASTNVTFRIVNFGGTSSSGTWYLYNRLGTAAPDIALQGIVTQLAPPSPPVLSLVSVANGQFSFTVTGTPGAAYIVQTTADLSAPVWLPILTNVAPFQFTDTNTAAIPQRFYRALPQK